MKRLLVGLGLLAVFFLGYSLPDGRAGSEVRKRDRVDAGHAGKNDASNHEGSVQREPSRVRRPHDREGRLAHVGALSHRAVDVLALQPGENFDPTELKEKQKAWLEHMVAHQAAVSGFGLDSATWVAGDERHVCALLLRDAETGVKLGPQEFAPDDLAELSSLYADIDSLSRDAARNAIDSSPYLYDTEELAIEARDGDKRLAEYLVKEGKGGAVLVPPRSYAQDPDVRRCRDDIDELERKLQVRTRGHWFVLPKDVED